MELMGVLGSGEEGLEERGGAAGFGGGDLFRGTGGDDGAAVCAGFRADVDDGVGFGHDIEIVFDDDDRVAVVDETVEDLEETGDVGGVEADGGFLDEVEIAFGLLVFAETSVFQIGRASCRERV
jgi:hypothetical protein